MAEYIKKEAVLNFIEKGLNNPDKTKSFGHDAIEIMAEVQYMPAADVVEVVRCKDCKYLSKNRFYCEYYKIAIIDNGFCYRGAKMDGKEV